MLLEVNKRCWHIVSFTDSGHRLATIMQKVLATHKKYKREYCDLSHFIRHAFEQNESTSKEGLLIIGATGIAVRSISPYVKDKYTDPPVVVIDDYGHFVISLLSGHLGGANKAAAEFSQFLQHKGYKAEPVITTATDVRGLQGIEEILERYGVLLKPAKDAIKSINLAIANHKSIRIDFDPLLGVQPMILPVADGVDNGSIQIVITLRKPQAWFGEKSIDYVFYSKTLVVGTGCRKGLCNSQYKEGLLDALDEGGFEKETIKMFCSIDIKSDEQCIKEAQSWLDAEFVCYEKELLRAYEPAFQGSIFVKEQVGVAAVAGPSALVASGDELAFTVYKKAGCTFSFGRLIK